MEELSDVAVVAIIFGTIYKLFELFAGRQERMMRIEKLSAVRLDEAGMLPSCLPASSSPLRFGCLLLGLGAGLLVGYAIVCSTQPAYFDFEVPNAVKDAVSVIYGGSILLGGGFGLIVAFLIDVLRNRSKK